ncbi:hypothetical protein [Mycolicibacterium fortuitum]|nr:hypothetical protein [Mycolicibacterium fortuitum]
MTDPNNADEPIRTWEPLHRDGNGERRALPDGVDPFSFFSNEDGDSDR